MKFIKRLLIGIVVLSIVSVIGLFGYLELSQDEPHFAGQCDILDLEGSAEDIQVDRERGFAYLSVIDRLALAAGNETTQGTILRLDLNDAGASLQPALIDPPDHFRPHGISLFIDDNGLRSLVAINHPVNRGVDQDIIELFHETEPGRYRHVDTFVTELITNPNDLVAVGPKQFYVAQDNGASRDGSLTKLVYFDGQTGSVVADDIASGGGINVSQDGGTLYVAETSGKRILVLKRDRMDGTVEEVARIDLGTSPDNIDIADDGSLWIGAHSSLLGLVMHFIAGMDAPSQVLRVEIDAAGQAQIEEVFLSRGEDISASSVGATYGNKLLIGSITAPKVLICEMDSA
jgi:arylesterase/paraoxonase